MTVAFKGSRRRPQLDVKFLDKGREIGEARPAVIPDDDADGKPEPDDRDEVERDAPEALSRRAVSLP